MGLFNRGPDKVIERGTRTQGVLAAIHVYERHHEDSSSRYEEYVVAVGGRRLAVRQELAPNDRVRLGMPLEVFVHNDAAFIDWESTLAPSGVKATNDTWRWKSIKDWGGNGVTDETGGYDKAAKGGSPATVRIDGLEHSTILGGLFAGLDVRATVTTSAGQSHDVTLQRHHVPYYATHLATIGAELPGFVDAKRPDRVTIDWPRAAEAEPGVGRPPSPVLERATGPTEVAATGTVDGGGSWTPPVPDTDALPQDTIEGVSWDTYIAVTVAIQRQGIKPKAWDEFAQQHGVPAGRWTSASQGWGMRMARDRNLQLAFAAALR